MRWIRYTVEERTSYGTLDTDGLIHEVTGDPFGRFEWTGRTGSLGEVQIEIPVVPRTFHALGRNYAMHARKYAGGPNSKISEIPAQPQFGLRSPSSLVPHNAAIRVPADGYEDLHYEGELVVVIGKKAKYLQPENFADAILGYTIGNDVSQRAWQRDDGTTWRAKNTDTFSPMGPWIETDIDLETLETTVRVNDEICTDFKTRDMLFDIQTCLCLLTRYVTLFPGDVLWMGTEGLSPKLKDGDIIDVEISGIGTLRNHVELLPDPKPDLAPTA